MSLNNRTTRIGLQLLSDTVHAVELEYLLVGGLAVQAVTHAQYPQYHRPTLDADITTPNVDFSTFRATYGQRIGSRAKDCFGLGYHLRNDHFSNGVQLIGEEPDGHKEVFLLHFTRLSPGLERRITEKVL